MAIPLAILSNNMVFYLNLSRAGPRDVVGGGGGGTEN